MAFGITLTDMKKLVPDHIGELVDLLTDNNAVLANLPFDNIPEGVDPSRPTISGDSGIKFRDFNAEYADAEEGLGSVTEKIRPFGRTLKYDPALTAQGLARSMAARQRAWARRMGLKYQDLFFNGDVDGAADLAYGFNGIKKRCTAGSREIAAAAGAGGNVTLTLLDQLIESVSGSANVVFCNRRGFGWVKTIGQSQTHKFRFDFVSFPGVDKRVIALDGVPFVPIWENDSGAKVIPDTESAGTDNDCTSFYAVKLGNGLVSGLQGRADPQASDGIYLGPLERIPVSGLWGQKMEWLAGLEVTSNNFIMRLKNVNGVSTA